MKFPAKMNMLFFLLIGTISFGYYFYTTKFYPNDDYVEKINSTKENSNNLELEPQTYIKKTLAYTTLKHEVVLNNLDTCGSIPSWLNGSLLRNGPGQFELNNKTFNHWFDGFAMIHRFTFNNGIVSYANKFLDTIFRTKAIKNGKIPAGFDDEPEKSSWFSKVGKLFKKAPIYDNANVNITIIGKKFAALTETPHAILFDPITLETNKDQPYDDKLDAHVSTAHPLMDPETQETFNIMIHYGNTSHYHIYKLQPNSNTRELISSIATQFPSYMHSFALTQNYVALILVPLVVNPFDLMFSTKAFIENFSWKPELGTQIIVIDRNTGQQINTYKAEPFFFFHVVNAYDERENLIIDLVAYPDHSVIKNTKMNNLLSHKPSVQSSTLKRLAINLTNKKVTSTTIDKVTIELPRINDNFVSKKHTIIYGADASDKQLIKINMQNAEIQTWQEPGCFAGEPVFVQKPGCKQEDEGVILSLVLDTNNKHSFLLILDAKTMAEVGRALVPHHIPLGFHGNFYG